MAGVSAPRDASLSRLCQQCGLCCDGTLFDRAPLEPAEVEPLRAHRLPIALRASDGAPGLRQPCAALSGTCCTIYADRPASCRRYECLLFRALADDEVDVVEAIAVVDDARARLAAGDPGLSALLDRRFRGAAPRRK